MIDLRCGDCLDVMKTIPDKSVDMILCDLPYGTTACQWDIVIPFEPLWEQYNRIIKENGAIVLFGSQPFTTDLINSNKKMFKYELIWNKVSARQPFLGKIQPIKNHENILVFGKGKIKYNPQYEVGTPYTDLRGGENARSDHFSKLKRQDYVNKNTRYPKSIITVNMQSKECHQSKRVHPTQKPVELLEYLIKTYTNENETVLDNCMGSGSTGVACINTNRNFIGIELDENYFEIAKNRIENTESPNKWNDLD